jgi:hypothetical protein
MQRLMFAHRTRDAVLAMACCIGGAALGPAPAAFAAEPDWQPFGWGEAEVVPGAGKVKAGIVLPITVDGVACWGQLDTGAPGGVIWTRPAGTGPADVTVTVDIAGQRRTTQASSAQLVGLRGGNCKAEAIATIGNAFFENGTLALDLKDGRFRFTAASLLGDDPRALPFDYAHWSGGEGGHIVVKVGLPDGQSADAMLDTGAASFGLTTLAPADWDRLTNGTPLRAGPTVQSFSANSWGERITCFTTAAPGTLDIGPGLPVPHFSVAYCAKPFRPGQTLVGVLGLRHLNERVVTLDYQARRWRIGD